MPKTKANKTARPAAPKASKPAPIKAHKATKPTAAPATTPKPAKAPKASKPLTKAERSAAAKRAWVTIRANRAKAAEAAKVAAALPATIKAASEKISQQRVH